MSAKNPIWDIEPYVLCGPISSTDSKDSLIRMFGVPRVDAQYVGGEVLMWDSPSFKALFLRESGKLHQVCVGSRILSARFDGVVLTGSIAGLVKKLEAKGHIVKASGFSAWTVVDNGIHLWHKLDRKSVAEVTIDFCPAPESDDTWKPLPTEN